MSRIGAWRCLAPGNLNLGRSRDQTTDETAESNKSEQDEITKLNTLFDRLFRYTFWADQRCLAALRATPTAQIEALPLLAHLLAAEHVWLSRLQQRQPRVAVWPTLGIDECAALAAENETGYRQLLNQLSDERLHEPIRYRTSQGQEFESTVEDILLQVATHGPYHRGQIARMIGRSGGSPINTDYITFTREVGEGG